MPVVRRFVVRRFVVCLPVLLLTVLPAAAAASKPLTKSLTKADIRQAEWEKLLQISVVAGFSASTLGFREGSAFAHGIATRSGAEHYVTIATELLAVAAIDFDVFGRLAGRPRSFAELRDEIYGGR